MATKTKTSSILALEILQQQDHGKINTIEKRRSDLTKHFRSLDAEGRKQLCSSATEIISERFAAGYTPDEVLWVFLGAIAAERDWHTLATLIDTIACKTTNSEIHREVAISLLELADNELVEQGSTKRLPVGPTALVMLTEMGLTLAARAGHSKLDPSVAAVVEYITSNLLARSNLSNNAMRLSLIHYLTRCPINGNSTHQLTRIINRFGHNLLEDMMLACFEDKKRSNAAFHFLVKHLNAFFTSSPSLAEMSLGVLKHYMLRFPDEFPAFLSSYCKQIDRAPLALAVTTRCLALLMVNAAEVGRKTLTQSIGTILKEHLEYFETISERAFHEQLHVAIQLTKPAINMSPSTSAIVEAFVDDATRMLLPKNQAGASSPLGRKAKKPVLVSKAARYGEEPTPLESLLALAS
jgi:hypothetical protein